MTDIVDRLRKRDEYDRIVVLDHLNRPYGLAKSIEHEAADEIVRLREALRDCVETWRPLLADADLTAHENPAYLTLMRADLALGEDRND